MTTSDFTPDADSDIETEITPTEDAVESRAHLLPEEEAAGSDDPHRQAEVILEESAARVLQTGEHAIAVERRTSSDTVEPVDE